MWKPSSGAELASVGDDRGLLLWDTRAGTGPALRKTDAHGTHDLHTVDWSGLREELLATGARLEGFLVATPVGSSRSRVCPEFDVGGLLSPYGGKCKLRTVGGRCNAALQAAAQHVRHGSVCSLQPGISPDSVKRRSR